MDFNRTVEALFAIEKAKDGKTSLKKLLVPLDDPKPRTPQSPDEMIAIARQWTAAVKRK